MIQTFILKLVFFFYVVFWQSLKLGLEYLKKTYVRMFCKLKSKSMIKQKL